MLELLGEPSFGKNSFEVERLSASIGAVVSGVDLSSMNSDEIDELRDLIVKYQVVIVKDQSLDKMEFEKFAGRFGVLSVHPLHQLLGRSQTVTVIKDSEDKPPADFPWHTDLSWLEKPPRFGFLQPLELPVYGGDTMWASLSGAFDLLSEPMQQFCSELSAVHEIDSSLKQTVIGIHGVETANKFDKKYPPTIHPLVRAHTDIGKRILWLSPMYIKNIGEVSSQESKALMEYLEGIVKDPRIQIRWHWSLGDVAIWDESTTVHRALPDHFPLKRRIRRCTVEDQAT